MKIIIVFLINIVSLHCFALEECTIYKVDEFTGNKTKGQQAGANYFRKHDSAKRGESIKQDPENKIIKFGQPFTTCKGIAERLMKILCGQYFKSSEVYTGNYGLSNPYQVPLQKVQVDRLHWVVIKDLNINDNNIFNNNNNEGYIDCK